MKKNYYLLVTLICLGMSLKAQTNCMSNGDFSQGWNNWYNNIAGGAMLGGGSCPSPNGTYVWFGDATEQSGVNNMNFDIYQDFYIPYSSVSSVSLTYKTSINTTEATTVTDYDNFAVDLEDLSGNVLTNLGYFTNISGANGIPGCQTWNYWGIQIPSNYWGMNVRLHLKSNSDGSYPTIFRIDDVAVTAEYYCNNYVNVSSFYTPDGTANTYTIGNITTGLQQAGCTWSANVVAGNNWLTCNSSGTGDGAIAISVTENPSSSSRNGYIEVAGYTIYVEQAGSTCTYNLSQNIINLTDNLSNAYLNVVDVSSFTGCNWTAIVTTGNNWLSTSSQGNGNGQVSILVTNNTNNFSRVGIINVNGSTFTVTQPGSNVGSEEFNAEVFQVYPNPAQTEITIKKAATLKATNYFLYNTLGETILTGTLNNLNTTFNIDEIANGIYFLSLVGLPEHTIKVIKE